MKRLSHSRRPKLAQLGDYSTIDTFESASPNSSGPIVPTGQSRRRLPIHKSTSYRRGLRNLSTAHNPFAESLRE